MSLHVHCTAFYSPATEALINNNNNNNTSAALRVARCGSGTWCSRDNERCTVATRLARDSSVGS